MRTHFLKDLLLKGQIEVLQVLPGFDFYRLQRLIKLNWVSSVGLSQGTGTSALELAISYKTLEEEAWVVNLRCAEVAKCKLPELSPLVYFSEIEVEDVQNAQLEGIRYVIKGFGMTELEIWCRDFEVSVS